MLVLSSCCFKENLGESNARRRFRLIELGGRFQENYQSSKSFVISIKLSITLVY